MKSLTHPTLLVSGIAGGSASLLPFRWYLRSRGIDARIWPTPLILAASVRHYGRRLGKDIAARDIDADPLTLVGWSMGGYICVDAMENPLAARRTGRVITFGTPFDGLEAARIPRWIGLKINVSDFAPGSEMLGRLGRIIRAPDRRWAFAAVNGARDVLAPGPLTSIPSDASLTGPYAHISLGYDTRLFNLIEGLIRPLDTR